MGWGETVVLMPYNERFKNYRRLLKVGLSTQVTREYWPLMEKEIARELVRLLDSPDAYVQHFRRYDAPVRAFPILLLTPWLWLVGQQGRLH